MGKKWKNGGKRGGLSSCGNSCLSVKKPKGCIVLDSTRQKWLPCAAVNLRELRQKGCHVLGLDENKLGGGGWQSVRIVFEDCGVEVKSNKFFRTLTEDIAFMLLVEGEEWKTDPSPDDSSTKEEVAVPLTENVPSVQTIFAELCRDADEQRIRHALMRLQKGLLKKVLNLSINEEEGKFDGRVVRFVMEETRLVLMQIDSLQDIERASRKLYRFPLEQGQGWQ